MKQAQETRRKCSRFSLEDIAIYLYWSSRIQLSRPSRWDSAAALMRHPTITRLSFPPTMAGPSSYFPDTFLNDNFNIHYNDIPHASHSEHNVLNRSHTSEVSLTTFHETFLY